MLEIIERLADIFALLLYIPAFITAFLILKEFRIEQIRFATYFKFLLLQGFIHSLFLVLAMFFAEFKLAFLIHSFAMFPLYALLFLRLYNLKNGWQASTAHITRAKLNSAKKPKIDPKRLKRLRIIKRNKSQWH